MRKTFYLLSAILFASCTLDEQALVPPMVDEDRSLPALDVNGTRLHLESFGDPTKPLVVFLHGGPGAAPRDHLQAMDLLPFYAIVGLHQGF